MPIEISPGQIIWVDCADEEGVPKSDENNLVLDFPGPEYKNKVEKAVYSQNSAKPSKPEEVESEVQKNNLVLDFPGPETVHGKPSKAEIQKNHLMENQDKSGLVQLTKNKLRKRAKNKVEKAENSQNSAKPSKPEEVESEVQSQVFENQGFVQLTKKKAEMDEKAKKDKEAEIKTFAEDPFGKWEKLEDTDIFDIPTGPIKLLTLTPNSFGPKCSKKRNVKRQAGL